MPVIAVKHPLIMDSLTRLRDRRTKAAQFRQHLTRATSQLILEAVRDLPLKKVTVRTPLAPSAGSILSDNDIVVVPVLRAGLGMLPAALFFFPGARVGFIGLKRDEKTFAAHEYYRSLPRRLTDKKVMILDPMLATGGSLVAAITLLKKSGAKDIRAITLVAAPEGIKRLQRSCPRVNIYTAVIDKRLNSRAYIVPGIGDAGDRLWASD